ncbi:glycosyltransferase [Rhodocyclus tenuis]|uniref:glycosyltransferase family 2 protein n=1 Tax=Rhodocyclus gracilis TaxID=2929842 RepID=UPI0012988A9F|nr:glycosyltransferase [Rhodocyclus gracilis]MRD73047.1 glycosyltransferase [Rhodocyclus gracilis]
MNRVDNEQLLEPAQAAPDTRILVSILIFNYEARDLEHCLDAIFREPRLDNMEVVICDDASTDGAWETAKRYARRYDGHITISRNNKSFGKHENRKKARQMCKGIYALELSGNAEYRPAYVREALAALNADPHLEHAYISRMRPVNFFLPPQKLVRKTSDRELAREPLVSICIYNYNYGRYLRQCFDSVFAQSYPRFEICFSDNASSDDSWKIACEYAERHPGVMSLTRNRINFGPSINLRNCGLNLQGKYHLKLCSDDAIHPDFLQRCVTLLEANPSAAYAMVHRNLLDEEGKLSSEPPFYSETCLIPGAEQAAVYMMSSVNPCISQILYNTEKSEARRMSGNLNDRWLGDRLADFHMCCDSDIIYVKEPLLHNRIHGASDGARMAGNLLQCMSEYVLVHQLADIASNHPHMSKARDRLHNALEKLGHLCLRYCVRSLLADDEKTARRYFHLALSAFPDITEDPIYQRLAGYWHATPEEQQTILKTIASEANLVQRRLSYEPPPGSIPLA